jgi:hypothetical protein
VLALVLVFNAFRGWVAAWSLRTGLDAGTAVGAAIRQSWLPRTAHLAGIAAGLGIGIAVPLVAVWYLAPFSRGGIIGVLALAAGGVIAARLAGPMYAAPRFGLLALAAALLFRLVIR